MFLEGKLREANGQLAEAGNQNVKLMNRLSEARDQIASLKEEVDKLCATPMRASKVLRKTTVPLEGSRDAQPAEIAVASFRLLEAADLLPVPRDLLAYSC
jgi:chromosome segregation ATPase